MGGLFFILKIIETCSIYFEAETALDKCEKKPTHTINLKELTVGEIKNTEHQILAQAQRESYHEELSSLRKNKLLQKSSTLLSLRPVLTDNSLHVGGRLAQSLL